MLQVTTIEDFETCNTSEFGVLVPVGSQHVGLKRFEVPGTFYFIETSNCTEGLRFTVEVTSGCFTPNATAGALCSGRGACAAQNVSTSEYMCSCPTGYLGAVCEEVDECVNNSCIPGAVCVDGNCTFQCNCAGMYLCSCWLFPIIYFIIITGGYWYIYQVTMCMKSQ